MYVVRVSCAKMPASVKARYNHVAVMDVEPGTYPAMISERARGVRRIVQTWRRLHVGTSDRCAYAIALREAEILANELNARDDHAAEMVANMGVG